MREHLKPSDLVISVTCTAKDLLGQIKKIPGITELWVQPYDRPWNPVSVDLDSGIEEND